MREWPLRGSSEREALSLKAGQPLLRHDTSSLKGRTVPSRLSAGEIADKEAARTEDLARLLADPSGPPLSLLLDIPSEDVEIARTRAGPLKGDEIGLVGRPPFPPNPPKVG